MKKPQRRPGRRADTITIDVPAAWLVDNNLHTLRLVAGDKPTDPNLTAALLYAGGGEPVRLNRFQLLQWYLLRSRQHLEQQEMLTAFWQSASRDNAHPDPAGC